MPARRRSFAIAAATGAVLFLFACSFLAQAKGGKANKAKQDMLLYQLLYREKRSLVSGGWQWTLGESEPVLGPHLWYRPYFSPDGNAFIAIQTQRSPEEYVRQEESVLPDNYSLVYWDRFSRQSKVLQRFRAAAGKNPHLRYCQWFGDSRHFAFILSRTDDGDEALNLDTQTGTVRKLVASTGNTKVGSLILSPDGSKAALSFQGDSLSAQNAVIVLVDANGHTLRSIALPPTKGILESFADWKDDKTLFVHSIEYLTDETPRETGCTPSRSSNNDQRLF